MELLGERPVWSMSGSEKLAALDALEADLARRQTYRLHLIAGLDHDGYAQEIGAHDTTQLVAFRYRLDRPQARRDVRLAQTLSKYAAVSAALPATNRPTAVRNASPDPTDDTPEPADDAREPTDNARELANAPDDPAEANGAGTADRFLHPAQAEAIVTALEKVPDTVPVEDLDVAERELVGLARHLSPAELRKAGQRVRDVLDTDGPEPDEHQAYARESLTLTGADRGVKFRGYLANENAELLRSLIHAGARPHRTRTGDLDPRPRDKRQADALTTALTLAATAYDTGTTPPATTPAHTAGADLAGIGTTGADPAGAGTADVVGAAGTSTAAVVGVGGSGRIPGFGAKANITVTIDLQDLKSATADAIGDVVYGDGLSAATIRRLACDAKVIPLVLGSKSEPLDVGRAERLVTGAMRRALNARDRGCVVCGAPPVQCDAHHLESWIDGGATAVHNLCLLCRRHHVDLHAGDWIITITDGEVHVARPTWADPPPQHTARPARQTHRIRQTQAEPGAASSPMPKPQRGTASPPLSDVERSMVSLGGPGVPAPLALVAASNAVSSASRRTATGAEVLQRLLAAKGESTGSIAALPLREAANLAIWGEPSTPPGTRSTKEARTSDRDEPLSPMAIKPSESRHGLHDDQRTEGSRALTTSGPAQWPDAQSGKTESIDARPSADVSRLKWPA
ncbi:HNH endonuclease signature motif containing protein [Kribbella sp. NBC_00359]|uniref:HNH endonuclease signature motif containing protein n=1 Tax=Kribbella sp. NBC_00359 TaxID=2975966 RepID=UPI002E1A189B